jgi:hypothetical protein
MLCIITNQAACRLTALFTALLIGNMVSAQEVNKTVNRFAPIGSYEIISPADKPIGVSYCIPLRSDADTPILIVIPGARRNAGEYRDQWADLATANGFIVLTLEGALEHFPTEYEYNAGGVIDSSGALQPEQKWLFSSVEPLFDDFCDRFGSNRKSYSLYGHSAGGGFVHRYMLMKPNARVDCAVAANPAFCSYPTTEHDYPFGVGGIGTSDDELRDWFSKPLVMLLGDRDIGPRTKPLSNGPKARRQGPNVFSRGLGFFQQAHIVAKRIDAPLAWRIEVIHAVGHSNTHMASYTAKYLPNAQ